jgi:membrane-associated protease RseP (regulator of RpoE activity)
MLSSLLARLSPHRLPALAALRRPRVTRSDLSALGRRVVHFWVVWSALLLVHEGGHAVSAWRQGLAVRRVSVGVGPVLWRGHHGDTQLVLRLVPVAGITTLRLPDLPAGAIHSAQASAARGWAAWRGQLATLAGGVLATVALALGVTAIVMARERLTRTRWVWGRIVIADAVVLTVFNFLPVPPLDGGRAVLETLTAWHGVPLSGDARFWFNVGGLALAVVPMTLWTRWTARIDAAALHWALPAPAR